MPLASYDSPGHTVPPTVYLDKIKEYSHCMVEYRECMRKRGSPWRGELLILSDVHQEGVMATKLLPVCPNTQTHIHTHACIETMCGGGARRQSQ